MADVFLRPDFATGDLMNVAGAEHMLSWARSTASTAAAGDVYRHKEGRKTLKFQHDGRSFFLKLHTGVGWLEILKNLLRGRAPVVGADNEFRAVAALTKRGIDTLSVAAYAAKGYNPATRQSMIVSDDLSGTVNLESYCAQWSARPPESGARRRLIRKVAHIARGMHAAGINHRDFYLCHFHLDPCTLEEKSLRCFLIDLHRAQIRAETPQRWREKDLAGLYFSAMDCGLTPQDLLRFIYHYSEGGLRHTLVEEASMWFQVERRAQRLYRKANRIPVPEAAEAGHKSDD
jgi:heptose I phosphotransferase